MKVIGIDPGLSGAIAVLEEKRVLGIFDMPVMAEGKKNKRQLNSALLVNLLKKSVHLYVVSLKSECMKIEDTLGSDHEHTKIFQNLSNMSKYF